MKTNNTVIALLIAAGLLATSITAISTRATSNTVMAPAATVVAVVDMRKAINGADELKVRGEERKARDDARQADLDKLKADVDQMIEASKLKADGSLEAVKSRAEAIVKRATLEAQLKAYQQLTDIEAGDILSDIHAKVIATVEALAKREGYQLVLTDDRGLTIPKGHPSDEVIGAINARRVLFVESALDITERVLTALNNEYNAGKSK